MLKKFYCPAFTVHLDFNDNGIVAGWLHDGLTVKSPGTEFNGLFITNESSVEISFIIEWPFTTKISTAFHGRVLESPLGEVLKLEWMLAPNTDYAADSAIINDSSLLVDSSDRIALALSPEYGTPLQTAYAHATGRARKLIV